MLAAWWLTVLAAGLHLNRWLVAADAFELAEAPCSKALYERLSGDSFEPVTRVLGSPPEEVRLQDGAGAGDLLDGWRDTFRILQANEVWGCHQCFVEEGDPRFGPGICERFEMAKGVAADQPVVEEARARRETIRARMDALLAGGAVLAMPTAPGAAPLKQLPTVELEVYRTRMLALTSVAGLCGLPQVNVPLAQTDEGPVGLSLVAARGADEMLLDTAVALAEVLQQNKK